MQRRIAITTGSVMTKQLTSPLHEARTNYKHYRNYSNCLLVKLLAQNSEGNNRVGIRLNTHSLTLSFIHTNEGF